MTAVYIFIALVFAVLGGLALLSFITRPRRRKWKEDSLRKRSRDASSACGTAASLHRGITYSVSAGVPAV